MLINLCINFHLKCEYTHNSYVSHIHFVSRYTHHHQNSITHQKKRTKKKKLNLFDVNEYFHSKKLKDSRKNYEFLHTSV